MSRIKDIAWLALAAFLALLAAVLAVAVVIALFRGHWTRVFGVPLELLLLSWGARGAWRRTSWGRARAHAPRRVDLRGFLLFLPNGYESYTRRPDTDLARAWRSIVFVITLVLGSIGSALAAVSFVSTGHVALWLALLAAFTTSNYVTSNFVTTRPLDCSSDDALAAGYATSICLRITFATSLALIAYTFAVISGTVWIYAIGAGLSLVWLWSQIAPAGRMIARDQRRISAQGCARSLVAALHVQSP